MIFQGNGNEPPLHLKGKTPKEDWQDRKKVLQFKWLGLMVLSHTFWLMVWMAPQETRPIKKGLTIEKDHQILRLPVFNFAAIPEEGRKEVVSLFHEKSGFMIKAFLRQLEEDPMGPSGTKATLEVPAESLEKFKSALGPWLVYPPLENKKTLTRSKAYEIQF